MTTDFPPESPLLEEDALGFSTMDDVQERRRLLDQYLWQSDALPTGQDLLIRDNGFVTNAYEYGGRANLNSTDELWVDLGEGMRAGAYLFHPIESNGCLFIYHSGHNASPEDEDCYHNNDGNMTKPCGVVIPALVRCGFTVLSISMPIYGAWRNPVINGVTLTTHDQMFDAFENPMRFFVEPVIRFLNLLAQGFQCVSMMGLSGGGWTTTLCAALDPRIKRSYPVAGSVPIWLRPPLDALGDGEQVWPAFYSIANYTELYVMGAVGEGRRQLQILNEHDPECFAGTRHTQWVPQVKAAVAGLGDGNFDFHLDQDTTRHQVSRASLARILADHAEFLDIGRLTAIAAQDR